MIRPIMLVLAFASLSFGQNFLIEGFQPAGESDSEYQQGLNNLDARQWNAAVANFDTVVKHDKRSADAALYWKAYALQHAGRLQNSLGVIEKLQKTYPSSRWLEDAKALSLEIQADIGRPVNPATEADQNLKLLALNSQMQENPKAALPSLLKVIQAGDTPEITKQHALFVLAQSDSPDARHALMQVARKGANPALRMSAVRVMSMLGGENVRAELAGLYRSASNADLKHEILNGMVLSELGSGSLLRDLSKPWAGSQMNVESLARGERLMSLYRTEANEDVRRAILDELQAEGNKDALVQLSREEKSSVWRSEISRRVGLAK